MEREIKLTQQKLFNTFFETAKPFLLKDKALQFMDNVKGTPAYWKRFLVEVLSLINQLRFPISFSTLQTFELFSPAIKFSYNKDNNL